MPEKSFAIIGAGNILCRDDGIGVHIVQELQKHDLPDNVSLMDAGTATLDAFFEVAHTHKVIVIDAVKGGGAPGSIYRFPLDSVSPDSRFKVTSLHQISLHESFNMARLILDRVPEVIVIGVEPERIDLGTELSPSIQKKYKEIIDIVKLEIKNQQNCEVLSLQ